MNQRVSVEFPWTYERWRERHAAYLDAIAANGGTPWTTDEDERRELWHRRYRRPDPPVGLSVPNIKHSEKEWI